MCKFLGHHLYSLVPPERVRCAQTHSCTHAFWAAPRGRPRWPRPAPVPTGASKRVSAPAAAWRGRCPLTFPGFEETPPFRGKRDGAGKPGKH